MKPDSNFVITQILIIY